jgi:hypothetical protein
MSKQTPNKEQINATLRVAFVIFSLRKAGLPAIVAVANSLSQPRRKPMVEANQSIQQSAIIRITTAAAMLAQLQARKAVKEQLRREGLKPTRYAAREISLMASEYLMAHRAELMPLAIETITRWTLAGHFGKRAQRALAQAQCAKLKTNAQMQKQPRSTASTLQISGVK